ncbi:MAG: choice-of-anchor tandem repeat GloVer-containing protein [Opitutaceae bacterium]
MTCGLFALSAAAGLLRADRESDLRNEIIPPGHRMRPPIHRVASAYDSSSPTGNGYTPQQLRHAYGFDQVTATGSGQIIAIVDAFGSSTVQADLDTFCKAFNIPSTTVEVCYPQGQPLGDSGWATETSIDVEWAHAIAPGATIVLVVAQSAADADLFAAVDYAVNLGATQVSMSWGGPEYSTEMSSDFHFNVPGVTFFASSGDSGAGVEYPSCSPYVVGVGGTTLKLNSSGAITSETAWTGSGGGVSAYETVPGYQAGWWSGVKRGVPDVSYDADPSTGIPVYVTGSGWGQWGGTSIGAPQWAGLCALANSLRSTSIAPAPGSFYSLAGANYGGYFHDIVSGSSGNPAGPGYDLVTGLGSPLANQVVPALAGGLSTQVAAPVFFPPAGTYAGSKSVTIVSATPGASLRYTTDGSTPTATKGTLYSVPFSISATTTVKAVAYKSGLAASLVTSGIYTFLSPAAAPVFSPGAGTYAYAQEVAISTKTSGATIRYTVDGSVPTETHGTLYSDPVNMGATATLQAIAYKSGLADSPLTSGVYTITPLSLVYNFTGSLNGGTHPYASLALGSDGNFYGTTNNGGSGDYGTVFKLTPAGVVTTLVAFNYTNGAYPTAALVQGSDGNFYGVTPTGGSGSSGTVFKMTSTGVLITLVSFNLTNGSTPSGLVQGSDGAFYGTATNGGGANYGTVFKMTAKGSLTTLVTFNGSNGGNPDAGLVQGHDGNFYGITSEGGAYGDGTVFKMTPAGVLTTLVSFNGGDGSYPAEPLIQASDGNFYSTTNTGGSNDLGTLFRVSPAGVLSTLVTFDGVNGLDPAGALWQDGDGNLYGATMEGGPGYDPINGPVGNGIVFKLTPAGVLTTLAVFNGPNGLEPSSALVQGKDGNLYGVAAFGGTSDDGIIFQLILPPQVSAPVFSPAAGTYSSAQKVKVSSQTSGASIRYTTDGSMPTESHGTLYSGSIKISQTTTLKAMAYQTGSTDSAVTVGNYTID